MKKSNRILALLLCLLMCVSLFPAAAFAEDVSDSVAEETEAVEGLPAEEAAAEITEEIPAEEPTEEIPADEPAEANTASFEEITVESEPEAAEETVVNDAAMASSGTCGDNLTWTLDDAGTLTISGTGDMTDYSYSSYVPWYDSRDSITEIVIGSGVTSIGDYAFYRCSNLTSVTIPGNVTSIGGNAFCGCSGLTSVTISEGVTTLDWGVFQSCWSLTSITIPASVTSIGNFAFAGCDSLTAIPVAAGNQNYSSLDGVLFNKTQTELVVYPGGKPDTSYSVPSDVTSISAHAFDRCDNLNSVSIPSGVTYIGGCAFVQCFSLTEITVDKANASYSSLNGVLFNKDMTELITYPAGLTNSSYAIPGSVTTICGESFFGCIGLTEVTIPASVKEIQYYAFSFCDDLKSVTFEGNAPTFEYSVFNYDTLTAYYPANDTTWTSDVMQQYDGTITWTPYTPGEDVPTVVKGDVNGDGVVNGKDLTALMTALATDTISNLKNSSAADMNDDGFVNLKDLLLLKRQLAG